MRSIDFDSIHNVMPGKHLYQFYKNTADYLKVMKRYFQGGLEKGDACVWLVSKKLGVQRTVQFLQETRFDFFESFSSGQFRILPAEEWYLAGGRFDEAKAIENVMTCYTDFQKKGYRCLRISGDAAAIPVEEWPRFSLYEKKADQFIRNNNIIAVCAYPILNCTLGNAKRVVDCHQGVLIGKC